MRLCRDFCWLGLAAAILVSSACALDDPPPIGRGRPFFGNGTCDKPIEKDGLTFVRCLGPEILMLPGTTIDAMMLLESPFPRKNVTVLRQDAQLVEKLASGWKPAPLSELYLHHVMPNPRFFLGAGAEIRGSKMRKILPEPYVIGVDGAEAAKLESRISNIQLVNIKGTPEKYIQESVECWCGPVGENATRGSLVCCKQNPTTSMAGYSTYQLEFNVTFRDQKEDDVLIDIIGYDVTNGEIEYNIQEPLGPNTTHIKATEVAHDQFCPQNSTVRVVRCNSHQHIGSRCMYAYNAENNDLICSSCPVYGTKKDEAGNELGYVVGITDDDLEHPYDLAPGTKIRIESHYDGSKKRLGVMGIMTMYVANSSPCHHLFGDESQSQGQGMSMHHLHSMIQKSGENKVSAA